MPLYPSIIVLKQSQAPFNLNTATIVYFRIFYLCTTAKFLLCTILCPDTVKYSQSSSNKFLNDMVIINIKKQLHLEICHAYGPQGGGRSTELCQVLSPLFQHTVSSVEFSTLTELCQMLEWQEIDAAELQHLDC